MHARAIATIVGLSEGKSWIDARRELTDEKIAEIHRVFRLLWPKDTDLATLLPKPDGRLRALFTGLVDPRMVSEYALGASSYFGQILIQNPFLHSGAVQTEFSPVEKPTQYRQEVLKSIALLLDMVPLIDAGIVNLFPDPCHFDLHLRREMMRMAKQRYEGRAPPQADVRTHWPQRDDFQRSLWSFPEEAQRSMIEEAMPELDRGQVSELISAVRVQRELDPLAPLQKGAIQNGRDGGLLTCLHLTPNLEMSLYLAQATGSVILTDSPQRWRELREAAWYERGRPSHLLSEFTSAIESAEHGHVGDQVTLCQVHKSRASEAYRSLMRDVTRYLNRTARTESKPNWESQLPSRFAAAYASLQKELERTGSPTLSAKVRCIIPSGGIRDNTVNRLLLMSSVEHYSERVPMAFFLERPDPSQYPRRHF